MNITENNFLTANEVSKFFALPLNTIYRLSKTGSIKGIKIGKQWRYLKVHIEGLIKSGMPIESIGTKANLDFIERRRYPRMNCGLHCEYNIYFPPTKKFYSVTGTIINISVEGMFLMDELENLAYISVGDPVELYFKIPKDSKEVYIHTSGRVVWKMEEKEQHGIGIKFRNMDKIYQKEINTYVD